MAMGLHSYRFMVITLCRILVIVVLALGFGCTRPSGNVAGTVQQASVLQTASNRMPRKVLSLPAGTRFSVRLSETVSARKNPAGSTVEGELAAPIAAFAETIAPRGSRVVAVVGETGDTLRATKIELKGGKSYEITSDEPEFPKADALVGFRLRNPVQVTVE
jgi:hypothetical protein